MNKFYAYIRISDARQGEGVSLQQQRAAIEQFAKRQSLEISRWFEERETAAKAGRPVFSQMIKEIKKGTAQGLIIHKIDRSARNLRDWTDIGELIDSGIQVHFANDAIDLTSRGGRLSADIQAVVAADYIRNLREEAKKGFWGRLKQGLYPMNAPLGYLNNGAGKPKTPDPATAPLVRKVFELYSTGRYNLGTLAEELARIGLRRGPGAPLHRNRISQILNNQFYAGIIHIATTDETFAGIHEPLVSRHLYERVQKVLTGKLNTRVSKHDFVYRRRLTCKHCLYSLIGEEHKSYVYYRCQIAECPTTCVREEIVDAAVLDRFARLRFTSDENAWFKQELARLKINSSQQLENTVKALSLQLSQVEERLNRLTDAYIDRLIEKDLFEQRKSTLLVERAELQQRLGEWQSGKHNPADDLLQFLERADSAYSGFKLGTTEEKRDLLETVTSNRYVSGKTPEIVLDLAFQQVADRFECIGGGPRRDTHRTWSRLLPRLLKIFQRKQESQEKIAA